MTQSKSGIEREDAITNLNTAGTSTTSSPKRKRRNKYLRGNGSSKKTSSSPIEGEESYLDLQTISPSAAPKTIIPDTSNLDLEEPRGDAIANGTLSQEIEGLSLNDAQPDDAITHQNQSNNELPNTRDDPVESVSRLFKRELLIQLCLYVSVYCLCMLPYSILQLVLLKGVNLHEDVFMIVAGFFPLAGIFNIFIYTRPNVSGYRRRHPECSRLRALWLVLKAGGEMPNENGDSICDTLLTFDVCCFRKAFRMLSRDSQIRLVARGGHFWSKNTNDNQSESYTSNTQQHAIRAKSSQRVISSNAVSSNHSNYSAVSINGLSMSLGSEDAAHRPHSEWDHVQGTESGMGAIIEGSSTEEDDDNEAEEETKSLDDHDRNSFTLSNNEPYTTKKSEEDDFWADCFKRVQEYQP